MIKSILYSLCLGLLQMSPAHADDIEQYKKVTLDGETIYLTSPDLSVVTIVNDKQKKFSNCKIANFIPDDARQGVGMLILTNDKKAIIFYSSSRYMIVDDLKKCVNGKVILHGSPNPESQYNMVVDINFNKRLYLSLSVFDVRTNEYEAIISHFGSSKNLIKAPGFFQLGKKGKGFFQPELGQPVISIDGKYVAPSGTDGQCFKVNAPFYGDNFPGVWDIDKRKKVMFKPVMSDSGRLVNQDEMDKKCDDLFKGKATLKELGGELK
ncbi:MULTISPECIES: hypothetical protein [unclassified Serratia (in: enterobacteria)]|uniref:hypothetical protein n=1 Tax=unclassified Serratia (in: enterobacteria) TaxID=2647522 RepID=UPI00307660D6